MKRTVFKISNMHCESCARLIENTLEPLGVKARVDFKKRSAEASYDETKTTTTQITDAIRQAGYRASVVSE